MTGRKPSTEAVWTDPDDAPELTQEFLQRADRYDGDTWKPHGRPRSVANRQSVELCLDADVLAALRESGEGWQTRINDTLRASLQLAGKLTPRHHA